MVHEKIFNISEIGEVKIIIKGYLSREQDKVTKFFEVQIKDKQKASFRNPIGTILPVPASIEMKDQRLLLDKIIKMSGISQDQIRIVICEFNDIINSSVLW